MTAERVRTLVVDDSALMRALISRMLRRDPLIDVVGVAKNGREAIERAMELMPDVVTLDIAMPEMDGLSALRELTKRRLGRVVMLSAQDDEDTVYTALARGAVDFVPKPSGPVSADIEQLADVIAQKVRTAAGVDPDKVLAVTGQDASVAVVEAGASSPQVAAADHAARALAGRVAMAGRLARVVGIGASTGGPPALEAILRSLPAGIPACFLVIQHLPTGFSQGLCRRLARSSAYVVREAASGDRLEPGLVLVAPSHSHMEIASRAQLGLVVKLVDGPPLHGVRPCADVLFASMADTVGRRAVGVILTGMGQDGAEGVAAIKRAGGTTIAQDESTAVVFGMPKAAIRTGAVERVVPLGRIAREIAKAARPDGESDGMPAGAGEAKERLQ